MHEDLKKLLEGMDLSDDFVLKIQMLVTNAINEKVEQANSSCKEKIDQITEKANAYAEYVLEEMTRKTETEVQKIQEDLCEKVDNYCQYVVERFIEDNKDRWVELNEVNQTREVLAKIKKVFEENYFILEATPANESLVSDLKEAKETYKTLFNDHVKLKEEFENIKRKTIFEESTKNLADTQKEKVSKLIEGLKFNSEKEFSKGIKLMVEEVVKEVKKEPTSTEEVISTSSKNSDRMNSYLSML